MSKHRVFVAEITVSKPPIPQKTGQKRAPEISTLSSCPTRRVGFVVPIVKVFVLYHQLKRGNL